MYLQCAFVENAMRFRALEQTASFKSLAIDFLQLLQFVIERSYVQQKCKKYVEVLLIQSFSYFAGDHFDYWHM